MAKKSLDSQSKPKSLEEYSPEQEEALQGFAQGFAGDVKALAKQYVEQFFRDKMMHCGGKIPKSFLFNERRMSMVLNYDIIKGVDKAYAALEPTIDEDELAEARQTGEPTRDIELVINTLHLLSSSGIPQQFAGGMLCMYLEFVEGVEIGTSA